MFSAQSWATRNVSRPPAQVFLCVLIDSQYYQDGWRYSPLIFYVFQESNLINYCIFVRTSVIYSHEAVQGLFLICAVKVIWTVRQGIEEHSGQGAHVYECYNISFSNTTIVNPKLRTLTSISCSNSDLGGNCSPKYNISTYDGRWSEHVKVHVVVLGTPGHEEHQRQFGPSVASQYSVSTRDWQAQ